ncbi:hypothetical protein K8Z61_14420 [Nocardioides sp. TRM66260-LWL]|uniref:hypothetical protein n=1 Tax=Nocardioides sp. TRM66260-LWL TaxID=2874478 RepID=UPI001CC5F997|nr:hypothetical protein [Nocardioides sp. TRM66260-LWL]MBZ5735686.1 hypothetical protein [Nocardioides sp. TRM66260-LWL]
MNRPSLRARLGALALALAAVAAPLAATAPARAADAAPDRLAGAPKVGSCYDVTLKQSEGEYLRATSFACSTRSHTVFVVGVAEVPSDVPLTSDSRALFAFRDKACRPAFGRAIGTDRNLQARSTYLPSYFLPTPQQREAGARWISCTLGTLNAGAYERDRLTSPRRVTGLPKSVSGCTAKDLIVPCTRRHEFRLTWAGTIYEKPTARTIDTAGRRLCPRHVRTAAYTYNVRFATPTSFVLACGTRTSR